MNSSQKQRRGVLVTISEEGGKTLLRLDDVVQNSGNSKTWKQDVLYTHKPMTLKELENLEFEDKDLAEFSYVILARLHAFMKTSSL